ncbi:hypothetical protein SEPCBS119000_003882 [Sporothrix epigloea]|uniref:C6 zinc finger domain containing protein n=1 Tax=Sporothrix epigloea TaxID=1892477 RepID=A0ABP0DPC8_9PEZI
MDAVKFVPPGGHRACLSCSAAKAKCVFTDDADPGDGFVDGLDFINSTTGGFAGPSHLSASPKAAGQEGTPAIPRCQRCERLNRDCLLPSRPRKKRRVGAIKQPTDTEDVPTNQSASFPVSKYPFLSELPTPNGIASAAIFKGPGSLLGPAQAGSPQLSTHQQYANGATSPANVKLQPVSHIPPLPGHAPIPPSYNQYPVPLPTHSTIPPPPSAFSLPPQPPVTSPPSVLSVPSVPSLDPALSNTYAGSNSSATITHSVILANGDGHTPSVASPIPKGPGVEQGPAPVASTPSAHQVLINSVFNMEEREADELLRFYRDAFSRFHPYMEPMASDTRAADLQKQKPLVWLSIVFATCYHDFERQNKLGRAIVWYITDKIFVNSDKSLHLLQGLMIFVNWFISQNFVLPQFTNLVYLTMALVTDLGLNKLEFSKTLMRSPLDQYVTRTMHGPSLVAPNAGHTLEERRALAGGFILSHAMSDGIAMITPLHYSLQLEDTCRYFEAAYNEKIAASAPVTNVVAADYQLAITVRLYYLISRVLQVQREADLRGGYFSIPVRTHIEGFSAELLRIWEGLSQEMQSDFKIQLIYYTAKIYIFDLSLSSKTTPFKAHSSPSRDSDDGSSSGHHHDSDMPIQCYLATKAFFDVYLTIPLSLYHQFPVTIIAQLVHADLTLAKLTAYFRGNTNPPGVPEGVKLPVFSEVIDAVAGRFRRVRNVPHPLGYTVRNIIFDAFAVRLRSFKVLDLANRKKTREKEKAAAAAKKAKVAALRTTSAHHAANGPPVNRTPPSGHAVLSISNLIGSVPEGMSMDPDSGSESGGLGPYPSIEMDLEADEHAGIHGDLPNRSRPFTIDEEPMPDAETDMTELTGSEEEDQADWWEWFADFQSSLYGAPKVPSTIAGSVSGASAIIPNVSVSDASASKTSTTASASASASATGARLSGRSGTGDSLYPRTFVGRKGPSSVASIDSLLNNDDQEPSYNSYIRHGTGRY